MSNLVRDFSVPRERVTKDVSRAFQAVQISLKNLEKEVSGLSREPKAVAQPLERTPKFARPSEVGTARHTTSTQPEITFSSEI